MNPDIRYENRAAGYGEDIARNVRYIAGCALGALALGLVCSGLVARSVAALGVVAVAALGCVAAGAGFGFLFSIPRTVQQGDGAQAGAPDPQAKIRRMALRDNTNLEQISDWLVKILIGASLVQWRDVKAAFDGAASGLAGAVVRANGACGCPSLATCSPALEAYAAFLILYFGAVGFLAGYLITKLWLPYVILRSALAVEYSQWAADEERARQEGARVALQEFGLATRDAPPTQEPARAEGGTEEIADSDPNKGRFGGRSEVNGLRLTAEVAAIPNVTEYYRVALRVVVVDGRRTLTAPVTFHLHPTFLKTAETVVPVNNIATLERASWGAFTVGVEIQGEDTRLELDLADLPSAPRAFRER